MRGLERRQGPECLDQFQKTGNGGADYQLFYDERTCYDLCRTMLAEQQGGLCAYCEIDMRVPKEWGGRFWDFQIEHFWPKAVSDYAHLALAWTNFLGCCRGGTSGAHAGGHHCVADEKATCGQAIGGASPTAVLNPYEDLDVRDLVYDCSTKGELSVSNKFKEALQSKAAASIKAYNLNDSRLVRLRKAVVDFLADQVLDIWDQTGDFEGAQENVFRSVALNFNEGLIEFFSVHRSYFNEIAERCLSEIDFKIGLKSATLDTP